MMSEKRHPALARLRARLEREWAAQQAATGPAGPGGCGLCGTLEGLIERLESVAERIEAVCGETQPAAEVGPSPPPGAAAVQVVPGGARDEFEAVLQGT